jgi:hypothetical protein
MLRRSVGLCLAVGALFFMALAAFPCGAQEMSQAYLQMRSTSYEQFTDSMNRLEDLGAIIRHRIYPHAAIGLIESGSEPLLGTVPGVRQLFVGEIEEGQLSSFSGREVFLAKAYNNVFFSPMSPPRSASLPEVEPVPIDLGPRSIPEEYLERMKQRRRNAPEIPPPFPEATSEFLLGHIAVAGILPESVPGVGIHNWLTQEEQKATEELISAMDWWARHSPNQELRFSYEINYATPVYVEPMEDGQDAIEQVWAGQSLESLGYSGEDHFEQSYEYVNEMRQRYGADWGFIVFILHGFPGQQFDGFLAYAYLGGPFNVNCYSNGYLGSGNLDRVVAHESGHTFYTLDEYPIAPVSCSSRSGYLNAENANKQQGGNSCKSNVPCVMRGGSQPTPFEILEPCYYTRGQVGWWDEDADGIPDILDAEPAVDWVGLGTEGDPGAAGIDTVFSDRAVVRGAVSSVPIDNRNSRSMLGGVDFTVEPVSAEYRVDGGPWAPCEPADGRFDKPKERFEINLSGLGPWSTHVVDVRAVTAHGVTTPEEEIATINIFSALEPPLVSIKSSNPSGTPVTIRFSPYHSSEESGVSVGVDLAVYDAMGRRLRTLEDGRFSTGAFYSTTWDGTDSNGETVPAGVYFVVIESEGRLAANKLMVIP